MGGKLRLGGIQIFGKAQNVASTTASTQFEVVGIAVDAFLSQRIKSTGNHRAKVFQGHPTQTLEVG